MSQNEFEPLLDLILEEEKASYNSPLHPYEQYREELHNELTQIETAFMMRLNRAALLLKEYDVRRKSV